VLRPARLQRARAMTMVKMWSMSRMRQWPMFGLTPSSSSALRALACSGGMAADTINPVPNQGSAGNPAVVRVRPENLAQAMEHHCGRGGTFHKVSRPRHGGSALLAEEARGAALAQALQPATTEAGKLEPQAGEGQLGRPGEAADHRRLGQHFRQRRAALPGSRRRSRPAEARGSNHPAAADRQTARAALERCATRPRRGRRRAGDCRSAARSATARGTGKVASPCTAGKFARDFARSGTPRHGSGPLPAVRRAGQATRRRLPVAGRAAAGATRHDGVLDS